MDEVEASFGLHAAELRATPGSGKPWPADDTDRTPEDKDEDQ